ncbi:hypothetical protein R3P38DRAFT_2780032 [Favolaschia claudopus]|uniref:Uncharacterized protein n=1 Tax=Favolaschia claudopus TaxID=2862362 RepID=A0AAW0BCB3_9AGAR
MPSATYHDHRHSTIKLRCLPYQDNDIQCRRVPSSAQRTQIPNPHRNSARPDSIFPPGPAWNRGRASRILEKQRRRDAESVGEKSYPEGRVWGETKIASVSIESETMNEEELENTEQEETAVTRGVRDGKMGSGVAGKGQDETRSTGCDVKGTKIARTRTGTSSRDAVQASGRGERQQRRERRDGQGQWRTIGDGDETKAERTVEDKQKMR